MRRRGGARPAAPRPVAVLAALSFVGVVAACAGADPPATATPAMDAGTAGRHGVATYVAHLRPDLEAGTIAVQWQLRLPVDDQTTDSIPFLLQGTLEIEDVWGPLVRSYSTRPFEMVPVWNVVTVHLTRSVPHGTYVEIGMRYGGAPGSGPRGSESLDPEHVELSIEAAWHPVVGTFDREMVGTLRVELPAEWDVVGSGTTSFEEGAHVIRNAVPQLDVAFSASPSFRRAASSSFVAYSRTAEPAAMEAALAAAESCHGYLNDRYGVRDPLPAGRIVITDREQTRYARKNYVVLDRVDPAEEVALHWALCHELVHYWTALSNFMGPDHWMSEAFAEAATLLYVRDRFGEEAYTRTIDRWRRQSERLGPVWTAGSEQRAAPDVMYIKAPYLLSSLEAAIGRKPFERFLTAYMVEDIRETEAMLDRLRAIAGADAELELRRMLGS
jgi:hypothetical protein